MSALLLKDYYVIFRQMKIFLLLILVFSCIPGTFYSTFAVVYASMLPYTALAYDERSRWDQMAAMMPYSARDVVLSKYLFGWIAVAVIKFVKVPSWAKGLMPTLIVPFLASLSSGLIMVYIIGTPVSWFTSWLTNLLQSMSGASNLIFGAVIGTLSIVDFGGPINKTAFAFALTLQAEGLNGAVTALQLTNTATPIGFGFAFLVAKLLRKNIYTREEVETLKSSVPMGVVNIVEGTIPIVMNDLVRGIVAAGLGGCVEGAILMSLANGEGATVPFGGFLMLPTMGSNWWVGLLAIAANVVVTGVVYALIKKDIPADQLDAVQSSSAEEEELDLDDIKVM